MSFVASVFSTCQAVTATVADDNQSASFTTDGAGDYTVRLRYQSQGGHAFAETLTIKAGEESASLPPTVRSARGPGGTYALAGDGLTNAKIETDESLGETSVMAVTPAGSDISDLHVQVDDAMEGDTLDVRVVSGANHEAVQNHVSVTVHDSLSENAIVWRNGAPITRDGETRFGHVEERNDGSKHLIRTYTTDRGHVTVGVNQDPGRLARANHRVQVWTADLPVPDVPFLTIAVATDVLESIPLPDADAGDLAVVLAVALPIRRRRPPQPPQPPTPGSMQSRQPTPQEV